MNPSNIHIQRYHKGQEALLRNLFFNTIRTVNAKDYSSAQLQAWAPDHYNEASWVERIGAMNPFTAVVEDQIVGYAGIVPDGYVDHFYIHHQWQRKGVGTRLMARLVTEARSLNWRVLTSDVSITARPFFEAHGFVVQAPQEVKLRGQVLNNFRMIKTLSTDLDQDNGTV